MICSTTRRKVFAPSSKGKELLRNASLARLSAELDDGRIIIKVSSSNKYRPPEKSVCSGVYEESGRGLFIIDCISEERSFTCEGEIKVTIKADFKE